jgi:flavoprotein
VDLALSLENVDLFLSRAAEEVLRMYHMESLIQDGGARFQRDIGYSSPISGRFSKSHYKVLVVAPATSNSVAKFVFGISDSLITNIFAQAGKSLIPIIVLPTDISEDINSVSPSGLVKVYPRQIDLDNVKRLQDFRGVTLVTDVDMLRRALEPHLQ